MSTHGLENPKLSWGEPVGTYSLELFEGGGILSYRAIQPSGGPLIVQIPLGVKDMAEMQHMLNMLQFVNPLDMELPDGRISVH